MAAFQNFMQFTVYGTYLNLPWQNTFCWTIDTDASGIPSGDLSFSNATLEYTTLPIWNDNGLILGLRSRYASIIPIGQGSVEGIKVLARSSAMLGAVQFQLDDPVNGTLAGIGASNLNPSYMAAYVRATAEDYGQSPARMFVPMTADSFVDGQQVTPAFKTALNSMATGILNSINSTTHVVQVLNAGSEDTAVTYKRCVVGRIKTEVLPPNPPYKGKYKYDMPIQSGVILAYPTGDFVVQPRATTNNGRKL